MCNLRFCSQLLVPIIMHFYFFFMQKTKTCRLIWPNFTKYIPSDFQTFNHKSSKQNDIYNTKCQTKARRDFNQRHKVIYPKYYKHLKKGAHQTHSWMGHYFFSYLLIWEVDLIEILEIMPQMGQYVIFLSLKPTKVTSDFILN